MNESGASGAFNFAELNYLRMEAMDLFERCLTEGRAHFLETFVHDQISQDPPRLELLREVAEDLHQRLLTLRENHFDVRDRVLRTLRDDFSADLSPLIPLNALESYHLLNPEDAVLFLREQLGTLTPQDEIALRKALDSSLDMAAQLQRDVAMTESLYDYVMDWVMGLNATIARRSWSDNRIDKGRDLIQ
jgi:hypothetical protein